MLKDIFAAIGIAIFIKTIAQYLQIERAKTPGLKVTPAEKALTLAAN